MSDDTRFHLTLTDGQAQAVLDALELYMRLGIGQVDYVSDLLRFGTLPTFRSDTRRGERKTAAPGVIEDVEDMLNQIKEKLGYPRNGSHGIGHPDNHISVSRSHEILKVLQRAVAESRDPKPMMKGVMYDGLIVRYTDDPAPEVETTIAIEHLGEANGD